MDNRMTQDPLRETMLARHTPKGGIAPGMGMGPASNASDTAPLEPQSIMAGMTKAVSGAGGMKMQPKTGMTPPVWPGAPAPMGPGDIPVGLPNDSAKVPPRVQRFETGQKMIDGYQNGWDPNPLLIRVLEGR